MASASKQVLTVQVRELVEFALRRGDLGSERDFVGRQRALAGTRGHQRLQRSRPEGYQKEVRLSHDIETADFILRIHGRIDGLLITREGERPREPKLASEPAEVRAREDARPPAGVPAPRDLESERDGPLTLSLSPSEGERVPKAGEGLVHGPDARQEAVEARPAEVLLEEIKTVQGGWDGEPDPLYWAQAKVYGFIYAHANALDQITLQLTYLDLDTGEVTEFRTCFSKSELATFFDEATGIYLDWLRAQHDWCRRRDESLRALEFPFPSYRPGQRELAVAAYRALARRGRLFLEAPTGIGKTISVLFPALKALGEGKLERIFYLTARTIGRAVAQKAFADLRQGGARLRTLTLTAKEKICLQAGQPCDPLACPFAHGYYDRCKPAMRAALTTEEITRPVLETIGREHQVCPFELSLDLSSWVDVVVCDYNYVFDPRVYLRRHFADEAGDYAFLVDEAHNLVDRAREMFSADLDTREIQEVRRALKGAVRACAKALSRLSSALRKLGGLTPGASREAAEDQAQLTLEGTFPLTPTLSLGERENRSQSRQLAKDTGVTSAPLRGPPPPEGEGRGEGEVHVPGSPHLPLPSRDLPSDLRSALEAALKAAETWLARNQPADFRDSLLQLYFRMRSFQRTADAYDERFATITEQGRTARIRLLCLDPSFLLRQALERGRAAVFFSATLTPIDYYRALLGGDPEDPLLQLPSPFPPQHLAVLVEGRIRTHLKARTESLADVVQAIATVVAGRSGNYMAYLPSYQYLTAVQEQFHALHPEVPILVQRPGMSEPERDEFLAAFAVEHGETLLGFAVMGGVFGETIDLVGDRLIGAVIVGVGLPQLGVERDLIRDYFQAQNGAGFEYAYTFPGMNRVLQATGRVIRSETDRGVVLLVDRRFTEPRYRRLFPHWWKPLPVRSDGEIHTALRTFWQSFP
jgi:DNA excision repair protein ERCC-2